MATTDVKREAEAEAAAADGDEGAEEDEDLDLKALDTKVWLVKLPRFLLDHWRRVDTPRDLGVLRVHSDRDKLKLFLPEGQAAELPQEYDLHVVNRSVRNTFVFKEDVQRRSKRSRTSLGGTVAHECNVQPVPSDSYHRIMKQRAEVAARPKREIRMLHESPAQVAGNLLAPGTMGAQGPQKPSAVFVSRQRERRPDSRATRLPRNEVMDMLFHCFESYDYWTIKGLKEKTGQPEAWLKEVLEPMANFSKRGPYALKWSLKKEYKDYRQTLEGETGEASPSSEDVDPDEGA